MKKIRIGTRIVALLLSLAMVFPMMPLTSLAALGDLHPGNTGIVNNSFIDSQAPVSLPIKIYDYNNDGMLFEYAESNVTGTYMGGYAEGVSAPFTSGLIGVDYTGANRSSTYANGKTIGDPFQLYSTKNLMNPHAYGTDTFGSDTFNGGQVSYAQIGAVDYVSPQYLNLRHSENAGKSYVWVSNFAKDDGQYYPMNDVRYAVIVYRTNDVYSSGRTLSWYWSVSTGTSGNVDIAGSGSRYKGGEIASEVHKLDLSGH